MKTLKWLIDNQWCDSDKGKTFDLTNPANGQVVASVVDATAADVDRAVAVATRTFNSGIWSKCYLTIEHESCLRSPVCWVKEHKNLPS